MEPKEKGSITGKIIYTVLVIALIFVAVMLYFRFEKRNFNDFVQTEYNLYKSEFTRDEDVKYSDNASYKIKSEVENDAMFYKEVKVIPNTPYKVTCMVKTQDVKTIKNPSSGGAHISIADTVEKSKSITGTSDWQKLEFIFNSKNRTTVKLGFRLGGYDDNCTGTAWFSDMTLEVGSKSEDTNWNFGCFVFTTTDVTINNKKIKLEMTDTDILDMKQNMARFKTSCEELSKGKMTANYDFIIVQKPITTLSYDDKNGYYVAPENIEDIIGSYIETKNYDHIFICVRLGDNEHKDDIPVYDWIGLGSMDYLGVGFSNIRLPNSNISYTYKYNPNVNTFPEEVFIHEFIHSLERTAEEYGYERPELHDYAKYGYKNQYLTGLKEWYEDYMNASIKTASGYIGLDRDVYSLQPNHEDDFSYSYKIDEFKEPKNIIQKIAQVITKVFDNIGKITTKKEGNNI